MFTDPEKNLRALGLQENNVVVDLGAGTGFYSIVAGSMVPRGKVYAIEINKDFLGTIKNKAREAHLSNVEVIWGDIEKKEGTKIGNNIADAVIVSNVFFQVEKKDTLIEEIKRILKPKGKVLFIDWSESSGMGNKMIVSKNKAQEMFEKKGFTMERGINTGTHHYGMILRKL